MFDSCDPTEHSLPGSSVCGILQARILGWVAISFSRGSSQPRDRTLVSCIAGRLFTEWATRKDKALGDNYFLSEGYFLECKWLFAMTFLSSFCHGFKIPSWSNNRSMAYNFHGYSFIYLIHLSKLVCSINLRYTLQCLRIL